MQIANKYDAQISVKKDDQEVNGKSIMGILMLAAEKGSSIEIIADGEDADKAMEDLERLLSGDE